MSIQDHEKNKRLRNVIESLYLFACSDALGPNERRSLKSVAGELEKIAGSAPPSAPRAEVEQDDLQQPDERKSPETWTDDGGQPSSVAGSAISERCCGEYPECTHVLYWYEGFKEGLKHQAAAQAQPEVRQKGGAGSNPARETEPE